ncbi:MAG: hypothetical protein NT154_44265 [Verrucomicrobia bacterium]|nr:hypothetical protein [Verrucomicrobiota bacterium]
MRVTHQIKIILKFWWRCSLAFHVKCWYQRLPNPSQGSQVS